MTDCIRWEPAEGGGFTGHAGTLEAFRISLSGEGEKWTWTMTSALPGQPGHQSWAMVPGQLKRTAEKWLETSESARPYVAAALAELRDRIRAERTALDEAAAEHAEYGRDDQSERCYEQVRLLDRLLAVMDELEAGR